MDAAVAENAATGPQTIQLYVNGAEYRVQVEPEESLRDCLREKLGYLSHQRHVSWPWRLRILHGDYGRQAGSFLSDARHRVRAAENRNS